ncbi:hypothetical protein NPIL_626851 [Nephila pilipes]|uniref:Uncharacterized protein n=1 Tax=Nephila pilipes TaxID=299642 RepID=A0A8X6U2X9_NEPPI|nr:hypothetical protein NPIL_626851 [Nephila pilipes]
MLRPIHLTNLYELRSYLLMLAKDGLHNIVMEVLLRRNGEKIQRVMELRKGFSPDFISQVTPHSFKGFSRLRSSTNLSDLEGRKKEKKRLKLASFSFTSTHSHVSLQIY